MKVEVPISRPSYFREAYSGQSDSVSHLETSAGVPSLIAVLCVYDKEGKSIMSIDTHSAFYGNERGYYVEVCGLDAVSSAAEAISSSRSFSLNFISLGMYERYLEKGFEAFSEDLCECIEAPYIKEAFLTAECSLLSENSNSGFAILSAKVESILVSETYAQGDDKRFTRSGFCFDIPPLQNLITGECGDRAIATLKLRPSHASIA